jgi:hypothetical protein
VILALLCSIYGICFAPFSIHFFPLLRLVRPELKTGASRLQFQSEQSSSSVLTIPVRMLGSAGAFVILLCL